MKTDNYTRLKLRLTAQILLYTLAAMLLSYIIIIFLVDGLLQAPFADAFVAWCQTFLNMSYDQAVHFYWIVIRNNKNFILMGGAFILLIIFAYFALSKLTRYLNQISRGADEILSDRLDPISLPKDLLPMQQKLNRIKNNLHERELQAAESEQRKNDLVVYLAHDLKTPLTSIIGYLNLLTEVDDLPPAQQRKYLLIALEKACRLESLINEFFDITRFNLQHILLDKSMVNLPMMLSQLADESFLLFEQKHLTCVLTMPNELIISADAEKIARVFNNLLCNAIAYSNENTQIEITVKQVNDCAQIVFLNHGREIAPEYLSMLFQKFFRLDDARSSNNGGSGLGLAIAKEIVERHQGTISAASGPEATTLTVTLPLSLHA